jgi:hypothetical protein
LVLKCWDARAQDVVSLVGGDEFALHHDLLGLADHLPGGQVGLDGVACLVCVGLGLRRGTRSAMAARFTSLARSKNPESTRVAGVEADGGASTGVVG